MARFWPTASCAISLLLLQPAVSAQTDRERASARSLAQEGHAALKKGEFERAIDRFERAEALVHAPPHLLYMARASEKLGRLVRARELYNRILRENLTADSPLAFRNAQKAAKKELPKLEPRIARLLISIEGPYADGKVTLDGEAVSSALIGVEQLVDPGEHVIEVSVPGYLTARTKVSVDEGGKGSASLSLKPDPDAEVVPPSEEKPDEPSTPTTTTAGGEKTEDGVGSDSGGSASGDTSSSGGSSLRTAAYVSFGVGLVGIGVGSYFLVQKGDKESQADKRFARDQEDPKVDEIDQDAANAGNIALISFVAGGLGVLTGVAFLLLDGGSDDKQASEPTVRPWVGYRSAGVFGRF